MSYDFIRESEYGKQIIIVIFEKYGRGKFTIQLEMELKDSFQVKNVGKRVFKVGSVFRKSVLFKKRWFRSELTLLEKIKGKDNTHIADAEVRQLLKIIPEIEKWWIEPKESEHIFTYEVSY